MAFFARSPETTAAGILALLGFLTFLAGALLKNTEATTAGLGMVSLAATALGFLARSEGQHTRDRPEVVKEATAGAKEEIREEAHDIARTTATRVVDQEMKR